MKNNFFSRLVVIVIITTGILVVGCTSEPKVASSDTVTTEQVTVPVVNSMEVERDTSINMKGTTWEFSVEVGGISYTFADSTYILRASGLIRRAEVLLEGTAVDGTGTYSVSGQTVVLIPKGGMYITVRNDGEVIIKGANSYTITPVNDSFTLDAISYRKRR